MTVLLDTDVCVLFLNGKDPGVREAFLERGADGMALCSVVKAELLYGAHRGERTERNLERLADFFRGLDSLPFDDRAADEYGRLRAHLREAGTPIGPNDLMIASIALARGRAVVTRNTREFSRVPGLRVEEW